MTAAGEPSPSGSSLTQEHAIEMITVQNSCEISQASKPRTPATHVGINLETQLLSLKPQAPILIYTEAILYCFGCSRV